MSLKDDKNFNFEERVVADKVADEILQMLDKEDKRYFLLVLLLLFCLIFLVSSLSFAVFDTYYNGSRDNSSDVHIDVDHDYDKEDDDFDDKHDNKHDHKDHDKDKHHHGDDDDDFDVNDEIIPSGPSIDNSKIYFSYNSGSNYIKMDNVWPTSDDVGMSLAGDKQFFDFSVEALFNKKPKKNLVYEISIVPTEGNTIPDDDVRVYLTENDKSVSVLESNINDFSDLPDSKFNENAKVIYRKTINNNYSANYIFRMWLSHDADMNENVRKFSCKIAVNAYSE